MLNNRFLFFFRKELILRAQMKLIISYLILSGMFLMFIPNTFFHDCCKIHSHHSEHEKHHDDDCHSEDSNSTTFEENCKFCAIDFDVLGLPNYKILKRQQNVIQSQTPSRVKQYT